MRILTLLFVFISLLMYINAPSHYQHQFCMSEMWLFVLFSAIFLRYKILRLGFLNFYTLFLFGFFVINYMHPVFIYPNDNFLGAYQFPYNQNMICSGLALAQLGISCFMFGGICSKTDKYYKAPNLSPLKNRCGYILNFALIVCLCLCFYVFVILRATSFTHLYPRFIMLIVALLIYAFYTNYEHYSSFKKLILKNKKIFLSFFLFFLSLIVIGSRGPIIFLSLSLVIIWYIYYCHIRTAYLILFLFSGLMFMTIITITRISSVNLLNSSFYDVVKYGIDFISSSDEVIWVLFTDLIVNTRNLYDAMVYPTCFGYLLGASYIQNLFVIIPFGGDYFTQLLLGVTAREVNTGYILTLWNSANYGLGTNMIGDLYMNFAEYGVVIGMLLLGVLSSICEKCKTINQTFIYIALVANSFYLPRASIFTWLDLWALLWLVRLFFSLRIFKSNQGYSCMGFLDRELYIK